MIMKEISESDMTDIGRLFLSSVGQNVLEIFNKLFYNSISFTPGEPDMTAFKEGQRDIVQIIRQAVKFVENRTQEDEE
jgi:hypothetical protein